MIVTVSVGDMLENIDEIIDTNGDADFLLHFSMQGAEDRFAMLDLAAGHDPETMKGGDAPPGEEDALLGIDNTSYD